MTKTLVLIFAALALIVGSFIWFVLSWDASKEKSISVNHAFKTGAVT